jgi:hypothetical protein
MTGSPLEIRVENVENHVFHGMKLRECFKYVHIPLLNTGTVFTIGDNCGHSIVFRIANDPHDPDVKKATSVLENTSVCSMISSRSSNGRFMACGAMCVHVTLANGRTMYAIIESVSAPDPCPEPDTRLPLHKKILNIPFDAFRRKTLGQCLTYGEQVLSRTANARLTLKDECGNFVRFCTEETKPKDEKPDFDDLEVGMLGGYSPARTKYVALPYGRWAFLEAFDVTMVPNNRANVYEAFDVTLAKKAASACGLLPLASNDFTDKDSTLKNILAGVDNCGHIAVTDTRFRMVHLQVVPNISYHRDNNGPATYCAIMDGGNKPVSFLHKTVSNRRENYIWYCHISPDRVAIIERFEWPENDVPNTVTETATKEAAPATEEAVTGEVTMERATMATLQKIIVDNNLTACTIVDLQGQAGNFIHVYYQPTPPTQENWRSENYRYWYIGLRMDDTVDKAREMVKHIAEVKAPKDIVHVYAGKICVDFTGLQ